MGRQKRIQGASEARRRLPAVSRLLESPAGAELARRYGQALTLDLVREELERLRRVVGPEGSPEGSSDPALPEAVLSRVADQARALLEARPRVVINATGIVIHTNLGRATLAPDAAAQLAASAQAYVELEYDLPTGERGSRQEVLAPLMERLFPGQAFVVVNNNAAAVLLCLRALAAGREVLISRGELVEIGGSFRVPDILELSGARLREVGTTNRTRLSDYERAVSPETAALLKVHPSNFHVVGFTEETPLPRLAELARRSSLPLLVDWGSGSLIDLEPLGLADEQPVRALLAQGADVVTFSGDKLLGGPQSGLIVGRGELVEQVRKDPLARACRIDRLRLGALHRTLAAYVRGTALRDIPTLRMLASENEELERRANGLRVALEQRLSERASRSGVTIEVIDGTSRAGGGSSPAGERPTRLLAIALAGRDARVLEAALREGDPPVVARLQQGRLLIDPRTVLLEQEPTLVGRLADVLAAEGARA